MALCSTPPHQRVSSAAPVLCCSCLAIILPFGFLENFWSPFCSKQSQTLLLNAKWSGSVCSGDKTSLVPCAITVCALSFPQADGSRSIRIAPVADPGAWSPAGGFFTTQDPAPPLQKPPFQLLSANGLTYCDFIFGKPSRSLSEWGKWMCSVCRCRGWLSSPSPFLGKLVWSRARAGPPPAPCSRSILGAAQQWCDKCHLQILKPPAQRELWAGRAQRSSRRGHLAMRTSLRLINQLVDLRRTAIESSGPPLSISTSS